MQALLDFAVLIICYAKIRNKYPPGIISEPKPVPKQDALIVFPDVFLRVFRRLFLSISSVFRRSFFRSFPIFRRKSGVFRRIFRKFFGVSFANHAATGDRGCKILWNGMHKISALMRKNLTQQGKNITVVI